jgi:catechol 2,3-dioxygenase-like lactoylglutathione lyase family enzyme
LRLEVVVLPVADVDRSKDFYVTTLGGRLDADVTKDDGLRVVQVTRPGSLCSIDGTAGRLPGPAPERTSYGSFASFSDPEGNGWLLQEITIRLPGR